MIKRLLALMMSLLIVLSFAACKDSGDGEDKGETTKPSAVETKAVKLPFSREDGLNPFTAKSLLNREIVPLVFSGLYKVDKNYKAVPDLAKSAELSNGSALIKLNTVRKFTDGSSISADDVVYSYECAKTSTYYASSLVGILSITAVDPTTVLVTPNFPNQHVLSLLTFPIVKLGTGTGKTATGCGRYTYSDTAGGGVLSYNDRYSGEDAVMDKIELVNITDETSLMFSLVLGNFNAVASDLSTGTTQRINASSVQTDLNNLVYLGLNANGVLSDPELRQMLSTLISKEDILSSGFEGYGAVANTPFNPNWYGISNLKIKEKSGKENAEKLKSRLTGYKLVILTNSDNNFKVKAAESLKTQLENLGVAVTVSAVPFETYKSGIAGGYYDIYIGEMKLTNDMNISSLISGELLTNYAEMMAGNMKVENFMTQFSAEQPFIPVCFRNGLLAYSRNIESEVKPIPGNVYDNITDWFI